MTATVFSIIFLLWPCAVSHVPHMCILARVVGCAFPFHTKLPSWHCIRCFFSSLGLFCAHFTGPVLGALSFPRFSAPGHPDSIVLLSHRASPGDTGPPSHHSWQGKGTQEGLKVHPAHPWWLWLHSGPALSPGTQGEDVPGQLPRGQRQEPGWGWRAVAAPETAPGPIWGLQKQQHVGMEEGRDKGTFGVPTGTERLEGRCNVVKEGWGPARLQMETTHHSLGQGPEPEK